MLFDDKDIERWFTANGKHIPVLKGQTQEEALKNIESTQQKINSFNVKMGKDNEFPELSPDSIKKMGLSKNKPVILKKDIIDRNLSRHPDVKPEDFNFLISNTLYDPDDIVPGKNTEAKYFQFIRMLKKSEKDGKPIYGAVLLDVKEDDDKFSIVHWHWVRAKNLSSITGKK